MEMMREANAVSLFHLLNVIDGTGDLEGQPIGGFKLLFQQWEGAEGEELLNDENAAFLHERFMDAHMRALEREGIV